MTAGAYFKKLREDKGYTMQNVVDMVEGQIDKTQISRMENDERKPSLLMVYLFSLIYDFDMKEIAPNILGKVKIKKLKK